MAVVSAKKNPHYPMRTLTEVFSSRTHFKLCISACLATGKRADCPVSGVVKDDLNEPASRC
jgi:hypothetical protein